MVSNNPFLWAFNFFVQHNVDYALFDAYYNGDHLTIISDQVKEKFQKLFAGMRCNLCPTVVDTLADRLILDGFDSDDDATNTALADMWERLRLKNRSNVRRQPRSGPRNGSCGYGNGYGSSW